MSKLLVLIVAGFSLLMPQNSASLYCFNQPCPTNAVSCDRDFVFVNASSAQVNIFCLDDHSETLSVKSNIRIMEICYCFLGEVLKTFTLYKSIKLYKTTAHEYIEDFANED
ncbi:unnamed protein product [Ceutorhynchus assimilis]|uniref:Uncharacterized protein n=1 Tax=Ceutorhynchus assimilis TaxID=467358 RepID=A0A9N9MQP8_9CUCU|nr:unnamed protein product [Ceutorhynchus assimilis]